MIKLNMKFDLKNIGPIKEASIKVDGLTVIAGENSIGKSAIGKAIFCVLNSRISKYLPDNEALDYFIQAVFNGVINNQNTINAAQIKFSNHKNFIFTEIKKNKTQQFERNDFSPVNVTILETPLILSLFRFIRDSLAFNKMPNNGQKSQSLNDGLPYYTFDLMRKIGRKTFFNNQKIYNEISKIISGNVNFDNGTDDFVYTDKNDKKHDIINVASGIKSFGLLQLLLNSGNLNENSILIIDEPEVHLHPFWQVEYAKVLVKLVENNIPVVVASHSPYFIEALKTYSDKTIKDKTNFYLGEMQEGGSVFKDVTNDLEPIFELLAIPMQQLMLESH
jgi:predicted ATPase